MKALIALFLMAIVPGCTVVEWADVKYMRLGGQELDSMSITRLENGDVLVELNRYKGEGIGEIVGAAVGAAVEAAMVP